MKSGIHLRQAYGGQVGRLINRRQFLTRAGLSVAGTTLLALPGRLRGAEAENDRTFRESTAVFANPERGFYAQRRSDRMERIENLRGQGISLLLVTLDLREFKERELTLEKLAELAHAFATSRENGFKVIFRAAYGFTGQDYRTDPADLERIRGHIRQVGAVLTDNRDVLCAIQAGMLGPWGEWHGSNHGNPPSLEARRAVLFGWLDAVPPPIAVQIRRPMFIRDIFAAEPGGHELTDDAVFSGSKLARTGFHNDAFLALPNDLGTYAERGWDRERELEWYGRHGRHLPFGGETVHRDPLMPIAAMIREMERLHATYLNIGHHPRLVQHWRETEHNGENTFQHIARRLGCRFVAERLRCARNVPRRGTLPFELTLRNSGFAAPYLPRKVSAALLPTDATRELTSVELTEADPRRWQPGARVIRLQGALPIPAEFPHGPCRLGLRLADSSERLRNDGRYAIRLANEDIPFSAKDGWNILAEDLRCE